MRTIAVIIFSIFLLGCASQQNLSDNNEVITTNPETININLEFELTAGKNHNHPSFAIWVEDLDGNYIETLYVTEYFAKGVFGHGESEPGKWKNEAGEVRRPAALPYWSHKRNIKAGDGLYAPSPETEVPDALTSATPKGNFVLKTGTKAGKEKKYRILFEVNQPWDSNDYWTNDKYPDDNNYKSSLQPALIYSLTISPDSEIKEYYLNPIGHGHYSGKDGKLYTNLTTITTAKNIYSKVKVTIQ
jgi:hypothetical protein